MVKLAQDCSDAGQPQECQAPLDPKKAPATGEAAGNKAWDYGGLSLFAWQCLVPEPSKAAIEWEETSAGLRISTCMHSCVPLA